MSSLANVVLLGLMSSVVAERMQHKDLVVALPPALSPDVGDVGMVWREAEPGPALAAVLRAFACENPTFAAMPDQGAALARPPVRSRTA